MHSIIQSLKNALLAMPDVELECTEFRGETTFSISKEHLVKACLYARDNMGFDMLLDIASVDFLGDEPRFQVIYELYSLQYGLHLRIKSRVEENESIPSIVNIWPGANWHEREAYDMMGIKFEGHPNLTRILMWEGYPDYPLRKDFPLQGTSTDAGETAFTEPAPLGGGPFVTLATEGTTEIREPRSRSIEIDPKSI